MKGKKAKEQLIGLAILSSVFVFFIFLKMNPEINTSSNTENKVSEIIEQKAQEIAESEIEQKVTDKTEQFSNNSTADVLVTGSKEKESIILFTERELKRAKAYLDKDWRPDDTINMAAWEYVSKNPNINNVKHKEKNSTLYDDLNQVANTLK
tara:strand:+ start:83 stop:538 length:456 start_codon:yes stop_codon:yes gene_type:complete